jgi:hypothetical protein
MSIHEHLPPQARKELKEVEWAKGIELVEVSIMRHDVEPGSPSPTLSEPSGR